MYDGRFLIGTILTGPIVGSVTRTYDSDSRIATESVNSGYTVSFQYDPDSLLISGRALTLTRSPDNGLLTGTTLGGVADSYTYSTFGEVNTYQASVFGTPIWNVEYNRDPLGRIMQKVDTINGATTTTVYDYDSTGHLTGVTVNGTPTAHYEYDANGNRLSVTRPFSGKVSGAYDVQDRLTAYGTITYTYAANGDILTATSGGQTTAYSYDAFKNLSSVQLPDGRQIEYIIDGQNRRIGKKVNGVLTQGFLYSTQLRPVADWMGSVTLSVDLSSGRIGTCPST